MAALGRLKELKYVPILTNVIKTLTNDDRKIEFTKLDVFPDSFILFCKYTSSIHLSILDFLIKEEYELIDRCGMWYIGIGLCDSKKTSTGYVLDSKSTCSSDLYMFIRKNKTYYRCRNCLSVYIYMHQYDIED